MLLMRSKRSERIESPNNNSHVHRTVSSLSYQTASANFSTPSSATRVFSLDLNVQNSKGRNWLKRSDRKWNVFLMPPRGMRSPLAPLDSVETPSKRLTTFTQRSRRRLLIRSRRWPSPFRFLSARMLCAHGTHVLFQHDCQEWEDYH